jgi:hypothetical protein
VFDPVLLVIKGVGLEGGSGPWVEFGLRVLDQVVFSLDWDLV